MTDDNCRIGIQKWWPILKGGGLYKGVWLQSTVLKNSSLKATGFKHLSLQTTFWLSTVYGQKLWPILPSTGFENAQLESTGKSIAPLTKAAPVYHNGWANSNWNPLLLFHATADIEGKKCPTSDIQNLPDTWHRTSKKRNSSDTVKYISTLTPLSRALVGAKEYQGSCN